MWNINLKAAAAPQVAFFSKLSALHTGRSVTIWGMDMQCTSINKSPAIFYLFTEKTIGYVGTVRNGDQNRCYFPKTTIILAGKKKVSKIKEFLKQVPWTERWYWKMWALIEMGIIHTRLSMGCLVVQQNFTSCNEDSASQEHYKFQFPDLIVDMLILRVNSNLSFSLTALESQSWGSVHRDLMVQSTLQCWWGVWKIKKSLCHETCQACFLTPLQRSAFSSLPFLSLPPKILRFPSSQVGQLSYTDPILKVSLALLGPVVAQGRGQMVFCPSAISESQTSFGIKSARLCHLSRSAAVWKGREGFGNRTHLQEHLPSERLQNRVLLYNLIEIIITQSSTVCWLHSKQNMLPAVRDNYYLLTGFWGLSCYI